MRAWRALALTSLLPLLFAPPAPAGEHIRVVLDISRSMRKNDPPRLAALATVLLFDLARPNLTLDDSFEVLPFHPTQHWASPSDPPPTGIGSRLVPSADDREGFAQALRGLPYDGDWTYFYPGLRAALGDLETSPGGAQDVRAVVLVTDGLPEPPTRDAESLHIREELLPQFEATGIRFYVLAFGPEASQHRDFFEPLVQGAQGRLGEIFVDPDGSQLLTSMAEIFSRSFGYTQDPPRTLPGVSSLDLAGGITPDRVAVAVFSPQGQGPPALKLTHPPGGTLNSPGGVVGAREAGSSYALAWVLAPDPGSYGFDTDVLNGSVAVLRPTRLELELRPVPPRTRIDRVMAETPLPLTVLVRPAAGARGDVPPVELSFRTNGERTAEGYAWRGDLGSPPAGSGVLTLEGREYPIQVEFAADPEPGRDFYRGHLEIESRRGEAIVGALRGSTAQPVEIYPLLRLRPVPLQGDARPKGSAKPALERHMEGCARFSLSLDAGSLPHPEYPLRAVLGNSIQLDGPLREATFTLDGLPLEIDGSPGPEPGDWLKGRLLPPEELLGEHEMCLQIGKPTAGDPGTPLSIPLRMTLQRSPYDEFKVVNPFTLKALVAPPSFFERWRSVLLVGLTFLILTAALWHLRPRPTLPDDLAVAVARSDAIGGFDPHPLGDGPWLHRLFALTAPRPVDVPGENRRLGWILPVSEELYRFRPARGVHLEPSSPEERIANDDGALELAVHRAYRVEVEGAHYEMRLEYR